MPKDNIISRIDTYKEALDNEITVDSLSEKCYISVMQMRRDFYSSTGHSVNEYLRYLRLSNALCKIKNSAMPLADIAYSSGYSSQQALCREMKTLLHTTATEYRNGNDYYFLSAPREDIPFLTEVKRASVPQTLCLHYYCSSLRGIENNAVTTFLKNNSCYGGRIFGRNGKQRGSRFCYELYVEPCDGLCSDGFERNGYFNSYDAVCAQISVKNNEETINSAWDYLYSEWLPKSMFEYAGITENTYKNCYFEEYYYKDACPIRLKLYLPLVRRKACVKITLEASKNLRFLVSTKMGIDAEKEASNAIIAYLSRNYPNTMKNVREFFCKQNGDTCTCGVKTDLNINPNGDLQILHYSNTPFAVMRFSGISDYGEAVSMLLNWLAENNIAVNGEPFAVYDVSESYDDPQMKMFCPICIKNVLI